MNKIRRATGVAVTICVLLPSTALPATGTASAPTFDQATFTWNRPMYAGDCEISSGATWTLYANGTARLDATVFSVDGDDAWLMWGAAAGRGPCRAR
jgi:hypothetical protein